MKITPIVLAGGKGTRLWPESRTATPKQLLQLTSEYSLLQNTILRLNNFDFEDPLIICNIEDKFTIKEQLSNINSNARLLLETIGKNTAPAIAAASFHHICSDETILVLPADHEISDIEKADGRKIHFSNADLKMTELNPAIEDKYFPQFTYLGKSSFLENYLGSLNRDPKVTKMPKEVAYVLGPETCEKYFIKKWEEKLGPNIAKMFRDACAKVFDEDNSIFFEVDGVLVTVIDGVLVTDILGVLDGVIDILGVLDGVGEVVLQSCRA